MKQRLFWNTLIKVGKRTDQAGARLSSVSRWIGSGLLLLSVLIVPIRLSLAETPATPDMNREPLSMHPAAPIATLAIFHDRPVPAGLMPALIVALHSEVASGSPELSVLFRQSERSADNSQLQILSGEQIAPGLVVQNSVTVYLHGECKLVPQPPIDVAIVPRVSGSLGWVENHGGHIDPFVHVECSRLAAMLARPSYGHNMDQRNQMMAGAISHVILHEWIHIATQNPNHTREGIGKAAFSVKDLLAAPGRGTGSGTSTTTGLFNPNPVLGNPELFMHLGSRAPNQPIPRAVK